MGGNDGAAGAGCGPGVEWGKPSAGAAMSIPGYEILNLRGPAGEARQRSTGRLVRLEQYDGFGPYGACGVQDRLRRRLEVATLLDHPHILPVLAVGLVEGR